MLHPIRLLVLSLALASAASCSSSRSSSTTSTAPRKVSPNMLSAEDIAGTGAANVYDAIQRLRPQWLTSARIRRGGSGDELQVYLDATRYGSLTTLRSLSIGGVQEVRYFSAAEATNRWGTGHTGGAILVTMNKQD